MLFCLFFLCFLLHLFLFLYFFCIFLKYVFCHCLYVWLYILVLFMVCLFVYLSVSFVFVYLFVCFSACLFVCYLFNCSSPKFVFNLLRLTYKHRNNWINKQPNKQTIKTKEQNKKNQIIFKKIKQTITKNIKKIYI